MMNKNKTIQKIIKTIKNNNLISDKDNVLVALSGGADSVFLLYVLNWMSEEYGFSVGACHVEHGIREKSSREDMEFVLKLCDKLGIKCYAKSFDVPALSKSEKLSLEAAGRKVRYEYFRAVMEENGYTILATAHHRDDKTETVVMNILRGCGLKGFKGIEYKNGDIIRPLLDVSKEEILKCCEKLCISYCTDETNNDTDYTRNSIRHVLLPKLREYNPSFDDSLLRQSNIFADEDDYLNSKSDEALKFCKSGKGLDIKKLISLHPAIQRRVMLLYLAEHKGSSLDISYNDVELALSVCKNGQTGKSCNLTGSMTAAVEYGEFFITTDEDISVYEYDIEFENTIEIIEAGIKVTLYAHGGDLLINPGDKVVVRSRQDGDCFYPVGMTGRKKLKDYFQDKKIPVSKRNSVPILAINGQVASVIGMRNDRRFYNCGGKCRIEVETI